MRRENYNMNKQYEELKTYLDKAMALKTAMTLFEWDNETLAPKEAGELTSNVIGTLSGEYFAAVTCPRVKELVAALKEETVGGQPLFVTIRAAGKMCIRDRT